MKRPSATEELRRIAAEHDGLLRAEDVVKAAAPKDAPLHRCFQWDNTEAGRLYRLQQAADLIRVSVIVVGDAPPRATRCFVSLTTDRGPHGAYREVEAVLSDRAYRAQLLADARRELETFRHKYQGLEELGAVFAALDAAMAAVVA